VLSRRDAGMSNVPTSTGLPITWQWCKRHDWKHEKVVCPFCRAEKAERELEEARKALRWTWREEGLIEKDLPDVILAAFLAARAAGKEER